MLRRMRDGDFDDVWAIKSDPEQNRWTSRLYTQRDDLQADWSRRLGSDLLVEWEGRLAGLLSITQGDAWAQAEVAEQASGLEVELGWNVLPWAQGQGVATEMVREGLAICRDLGVHRVVANCFADNVASWKVMEKVGMRRETHAVRDSLHRDGTWRDGFTYALLADEIGA